jgi:hypothetical protein
LFGCCGALLNDEQLKQEIDLVHQSSIKAFARALAKVRRPEVDTISTIIQQNISIGNTPCVIYRLLSIYE